MKKQFVMIFAALLISALSCQPAKGDSGKNSTEKAQSTEEMTQKPKNDKPQNKMENLTKVLITTSLGDITIALYDKTPQHRDNFIKLVKENYYDGVLFHRIIQQFMIQTGDPDSKTAKPGQMLGSGGPNYKIPAEFVPSLFHKRGAVAAARMGDQVNPEKKSSGSQFYIVDGRKYSSQELNNIAFQSNKQFSQAQREAYMTIGGAPFLDGDYTVFGEVIEGMDIVDKIAAQPKDRADRPTTDIKIISTTIIDQK